MENSVIAKITIEKLSRVTIMAGMTNIKILLYVVEVLRETER